MPSEIITYDIKSVPINQIFNNPSNPRKINEKQFDRLVQSIKDAPWMLKLRPIVVNRDGVILGGNQRFKACQKAGMKSVWVLCADQITDEQQKKFIIRDNVDFGKWDLEILKQQYTPDELLKYGQEIELLERSQAFPDDTIVPPPPLDDGAKEPTMGDDEVDYASKNYNDNTIKQIVFQLPTDLYEEALKDLDDISKELDCDDNSEVFLRLINFYEFSNGLEDPDINSL